MYSHYQSSVTIIQSHHFNSSRIEAWHSLGFLLRLGGRRQQRVALSNQQPFHLVVSSHGPMVQWKHSWHGSRTITESDPPKNLSVLKRESFAFRVLLGEATSKLVNTDRFQINLLIALLDTRIPRSATIPFSNGTVSRPRPLQNERRQAGAIGCVISTNAYVSDCRMLQPRRNATSKHIMVQSVSMFQKQCAFWFKVS